MGKYADDEEIIFDTTPNENEEEYRIVGTNYRHLTTDDIGESDRFWIIAERNNPHDPYAVRVENSQHTHVGYLSKEENRIWHRILINSCKGKTPAMRCRGFIGRFYNDEEKLSYYGKVFLPIPNLQMEQHSTSATRSKSNPTSQNKSSMPYIITLILAAAVYIGVVHFDDCTGSAEQEVSDKTEAVDNVIRNFITLNAPEIAWYHIDGNNCYVGFKEWNTDNVTLVCDIIASKGNLVTDFGFHVWACSAVVYPQFSESIMTERGYKYATTYRYGEKE